MIDNRGLYADTDKLGKIRYWRIPRNYNDVQKLLGIIMYLGHFLPDITAYTTPLSDMALNHQPFYWRPIHDMCFERIKQLCCSTPILCPIWPDLDEPIWVICDASIRGVGGMYGQGPTWQTCRPAGFMSKKFLHSQKHYAVFEQETLAILKALLKWEDKLIGYRIYVVTDHKALEFFKTQRQLSSQQMRWMEYLAHFDFDINYVKGVNNKVVDALSRYYETDEPDEVQPPEDYANTDICLDKLGEDLPSGCLQEVHEHLRAMQTRWQTEARKLAECLEPRNVEAAEMEAAREPKPEVPHELPTFNPTVLESRAKDKMMPMTLETDDKFLADIRQWYSEDLLFSKIIKKPDDHPWFSVTKGLIFTNNLGGEHVLCIPKSPAGQRSLRGAIWTRR